MAGGSATTPPSPSMGPGVPACFHRTRSRGAAVPHQALANAASQLDVCGVMLRSAILAELLSPPWNLLLGKGSCNKHFICQLSTEVPAELTHVAFNPFTAGFFPLTIFYAILTLHLNTGSVSLCQILIERNSLKQGFSIQAQSAHWRLSPPPLWWFFQVEAALNFISAPAIQP